MKKEHDREKVGKLVISIALDLAEGSVLAGDKGAESFLIFVCGSRSQCITPWGGVGLPECCTIADCLQFYCLKVF